MQRSMISAPLLALALGFANIHGSIRAQAGGNTVTYPAGADLIAGPPGTDFSAADGPLSTLQTGDRDYESVQPSAGTAAGFGYWAQFDAPTSVQLSAGSATPYSAPALAGQWILIGDPSGTLPASVTGATAVYTYDPTNGYQQAGLLQPGQGAWALGSGGSITVSPQTAAAQAAAATLHTVSGKGFQLGIPTGWDPLSLGPNPGSIAGKWASSDGQSVIEVDGPIALPAGVPLNAARITAAVLSDPKVLESFGNAQISSAPATIAIQGADTAAEASVTATDPQAGPYVGTLILAIANNNFYLLAINAPPDAAAQNQALFQQVIQSFQLTP